MRMQRACFSSVGRVGAGWGNVKLNPVMSYSVIRGVSIEHSCFAICPGPVGSYNLSPKPYTLNPKP